MGTATAVAMGTKMVTSVKAPPAVPAMPHRLCRRVVFRQIRLRSAEFVKNAVADIGHAGERLAWSGNLAKCGGACHSQQAGQKQSSFHRSSPIGGTPFQIFFRSQSPHVHP